jgi:hypothetical protein
LRQLQHLHDSSHLLCSNHPSALLSLPLLPLPLLPLPLLPLPLLPLLLLKVMQQQLWPLLYQLHYIKRVSQVCPLPEGCHCTGRNCYRQHPEHLLSQHIDAHVWPGR